MTEKPLKLLLATDGSESARLALDFLRVFPLPRDSELTILTVVDKALYGNGEEEDARDDELHDSRTKAKSMLTEDAEKLLEDESERFENPDLSWSTLVRYGQPAEEIIDAAAELDADLVVMGNHGLGSLQRFMLGSTSDRVVQYASCSVLIVRPDRTGDTDDSMLLQHPLRILLAYDDSPHARRAAEFCASLPMHEDTQVTALSIMPLVTMYRQDIKQQMSWMWKEKLKVIEKGLEAVTKQIAWPTPHVDSQLRESADVSDEIVKAADELDIDMIVVGNKGEGAIKQFLLGSETRRIAHHAPCSVLVVRSSPESG